MKKVSLLLLIIVSLLATSFAGVGVPRAKALTVTNVTLSSHQAGAASAYTITGTISVALQPSIHVVTITFPIGTTVPTAVLPTNQVTLNSHAASSVGNAGSSVVAPTLVVYVPSSIAAGNLTIAIAATAGIKNPTTAATNYTLSVSTTVEPTPVSSLPYAIVPSITNVTVSVDPPSAGQAAAYTVSFTAGSAITAGSFISIAFPTGTAVPASYAQNTVYVLGVPSLAYGTGQTLIIYVPTSVSIPAGGFAFIQISQTANIKNPQTPGTYQVSISTNVDTTPVWSAAYSITGSSVSNVSLTADPQAQSAAAEFTVAFRTSASGVLTQNVGTITIDFPYNVVVPSSISKALVTINGVVAYNVSVGANGIIVITVPQSIPANTLVTVVLSRNIGITNPAATGSTVTLSVFTSADVAPVSVSYTTVASQITQPQVQLTSYGASSVSGYTITFSTGAVGSLRASYDSITVTFPAGSILPATISRDLIKVNGVAAYGVSVSGTRLMIAPAININASTAVQIAIDKNAGIKNPATAQSVTLQVYTSVEVNPVTSAAFAIVNLPKTLIIMSPVAPDGLNGYYKTRPTVVLTATSPVDPAPTIFYAINGGAQQIYSASFQLPDGTVTLTYYARDRQGNQEDVQTFTAKVDATAPTATILSPAQGAVVGTSPVTVVGKVSPGMQVSVAGSSVTVSPTGDFTTNVALKEGLQTITFTVTSVSGNIGQTQLSLTLDTTPPVLTITKPIMYSTVTTSIVEVAGKTEPGAIVKVAGSAATVNADGTFSMNVMLKAGDNLIEITAADAFGNQRKTSIPVTYKARTVIHLQIGNKTAMVNDVKKSLQSAPVNVKGTTMVPLRFIGEAFGATVTWDPVFQVIDIELKGSTIRLQIGTNFASVAGKKVILQAVPVVLKGTTMVPIRFISEAFGAEVVWTAATQGIDITYPKP